MRKEVKQMYYKALVAGIAIGLGGTAYLSIDNHVIGALVFSLGLLLICITDLELFTGKLCFTVKWFQAPDLIFVYMWNYIGVTLTATVVYLAKPELLEKANALCSMKLEEGWRVIFLGMLCNVLIFFAVSCFNREKTGSYLILVLCIMAFILCGFEHSIANMFYFVLGGMAWKSWWYIALNTIGNLIGGMLIFRIQARALGFTYKVVSVAEDEEAKEVE